MLYFQRYLRQLDFAQYCDVTSSEACEPAMKNVYILRGASSAVVRARVAWPCLKKVRLRFVNGLV